MPIYEYRCDDCGALFEVFQKMSDDPLVECEQCGGPLQKVLHPVAIHFKGSGFYTTDYGKGSGRPAGSRDSGTGEASSSADSGGSGSGEASSSADSGDGRSAASEKPAAADGKAKETQKTT